MGAEEEAASRARHPTARIPGYDDVAESSPLSMSMADIEDLTVRNVQLQKQLDVAMGLLFKQQEFIDRLMGLVESAWEDDDE